MQCPGFHILCGIMPCPWSFCLRSPVVIKHQFHAKCIISDDRRFKAEIGSNFLRVTKTNIGLHCDLLRNRIIIKGKGEREEIMCGRDRKIQRKRRWDRYIVKEREENTQRAERQKRGEIWKDESWKVNCLPLATSSKTKPQPPTQK